MKKIEKQKRHLIEEANKRILNEALPETEKEIVQFGHKVVRDLKTLTHLLQNYEKSKDLDYDHSASHQIGNLGRELTQPMDRLYKNRGGHKEDSIIDWLENEINDMGIASSGVEPYSPHKNFNQLYIPDADENPWDKSRRLKQSGIEEPDEDPRMSSIPFASPYDAAILKDLDEFTYSSTDLSDFVDGLDDDDLGDILADYFDVYDDLDDWEEWVQNYKERRSDGPTRGY